eukprot:Hpha_TRINITY_DN20436_c0_g1::TRINITY_DN20436_c0_g1_i1::g.64204::m.64204
MFVFVLGFACGVVTIWYGGQKVVEQLPSLLAAHLRKAKQKFPSPGSSKPVEGEPPPPITTFTDSSGWRGPCSFALRTESKVRGEWRSGEVQLKGGTELHLVEKGTSQRAICSIHMENWVMRLVIHYNKRKGRECARWHPENHLLLTPRKKRPGVEVDGVTYIGIELKFPIGRDLERWYDLLLKAARRQTAGAVGNEWHRRLEEVKACQMRHECQSQRTVCLLISRLFFHWQARPAFNQFIQKLVNNQLAKLVLPKPFKGSIKMIQFELGSRLPVLSGVFEPELHEDGDIAIEADLTYMQGTAFLVMSIDVDLSLAGRDLGIVPRVEVTARLNTFRGRMRFEITGGESRYLWFGFVGHPDLDLGISSETPNLPFLKLPNIPEVNEAAQDLVKKALVDALTDGQMVETFIPLIHETEAEQDEDVEGEEEPDGTSLTPTRSPRGSPKAVGISPSAPPTALVTNKIFTAPSSSTVSQPQWAGSPPAPAARRDAGDAEPPIVAITPPSDPQSARPPRPATQLQPQWGASPQAS